MGDVDGVDWQGEIDRVMHGNIVRSLGGARGRHAGGEWDYLKTTVPARTMRILTGAGYFGVRGEYPDVAAALIVQRVPGVETDDEAMRWYVDTARRALEQRRRERRYSRHLRVARAAGHATYYEHRVALARAAGYPSLYAYRIAAGWGSGHDVDDVVDWRTWRQHLDTIRKERTR